MAEPLRPAATKAYGRTNLLLIPTWAGFAAGTGPTVAEINSASGLDVTNIVFNDGAPMPDTSTNIVEQQRRYGDQKVREFIGETRVSGGQMEYALASQAAPAADGVKLWELIPDGTIMYLVRRLGVVRATTPIATHRVTGWQIEFGPSFEMPRGEGENAEAAARTTFAVLEGPVQRVAVVA